MFMYMYSILRNKLLEFESSAGRCADASGSPTHDASGETAPHDKTKFSMHIPDFAADLPPRSSIALVGIESHICVTQTALDLRDAGHKVYVMADGVSSCNPTEVSVALDRLRAEPGITVTTSESWLYETMGDAAIPEFRDIAKVVKESSADTKTALGGLLSKI